ncbi:hypothetical protein LZ30DRAFT_711674 [Colletotrichum cereale]|nr:hypothetical protein LZ30DRAFT_711674 [Colletotrichum cereale]
MFLDMFAAFSQSLLTRPRTGGHCFCSLFGVRVFGTCGFDIPHKDSYCTVTLLPSRDHGSGRLPID